MLLGRAHRVACLAALILCAATGVEAQDFPTRPIEIIVPWGPGGGADQIGRKVAKLLEPRLGVPITVTNISGAGGQKGLAKMRAAAADGHTLSILTADTFGLLVMQQTSSRIQDIAPVAILIRQFSGFLVRQPGRFRTWKDVEAAAKGESVRVAITGTGSPDDLTVNYLVRKGLKFVTVGIAKPGERHASVLNGLADVLYEQIGDVRSFVDNQQMRPVLLFAEKRDARLKDVPTSFELGYEIGLPQFRALVATGATDARVIDRLASALSDAAGDPAYAAFLDRQFADPSSYLPATEAGSFMRRAQQRLLTLAAEQNAMAGK